MRDFRVASRALAVAPWTTLLACAGLAITDVALSVATPGYDAVSDTSSQLMSAGEPYSAVARVVLGLYALLLLPFALLLWREFGVHRVTGAVAVAGIGTHIAAALATAIALNDSDAHFIGGFSANAVHDQSAIVMFAVVVPALAAVAAARGVGKMVRLGTWATFAVVLASGVLFMFEAAQQVDGVVERTIAVAFMVWMAAFAMSGRRLARGDDLARSETG